MLARAASRAASAASRATAPACASAWCALRGYVVGSSDDDGAAADRGGSSDETSAAVDGSAPLTSAPSGSAPSTASPPSAGPAADDRAPPDPSSSASAEPPAVVTVESTEHGEADEDAAAADAAFAAAAAAAAADPGPRWYGGVEPHAPPARPREREGATFSLAARAASVAELASSDVGRFWTLPEAAGGELDASSADSASASASVLPDDLIPAGLLAEFEASGTRRVMFRAAHLDLIDAAVRERKPTATLLAGDRGAGKSVSLFALASAARATPGFLLAYVPSARALTIDSSYQKDQASGKWDTPEHARLFLRWVKLGNDDATLAAAASSAPEASSVLAAVDAGLDAFEKEPKRTVEAALAVIEDLKTAAGAGTPVLFVVDEYAALHGPTDMHEVLGARKRGNIRAGETRLCAALRDAGGITAAGAGYVAATSGTIQLSPKLDAAMGTAEAPGSEALVRVEAERMRTGEIVAMVRHYDHARGGLDAVDASVDHEQLALRLRVLTQGNGKEMREMCGVL